MTQIAVPNFGNYSIAFAAAVESLGVKAWVSMSTAEIIKLGSEAAPECACLPFKSCLGHFIKAAQEGIEYGIIVNSVGTCRLRYYRIIQQKIIDDLGLKMRIFGLGYDGFKPPLVRYFDPTIPTFLKGVARAILKMRVVDILEMQAWRTRSFELHVGDTSRIMSVCLKELKEAKTRRDTHKFRKTIPVRFGRIPVDTGKKHLKVALIGEASVLRDKYLCHNAEEILGGIGVEVFNFFLLGNELKKIFQLQIRDKYSRKNLMKIAHPYLKSLVGGHALESVAYSILCAEDGYDGIVHMCPTGCMPEISIRPILGRVSHDYDIPVLECSFDEHTSHVGVVTRLEAFIDILQEKKKAS